MLTLRSIIILSFVCLIFEAATDDSNRNSKCLDGSLTTPGWTSPKGDIELEVGQPLEIYCMLDSNNTLTEKYTAQDIVFKKGNRKVDSEFVTLVNETTARLFMKNLNVSVEAEYVYCQLNLRGNDVVTLSPSASSLELPSTPEQIICLNAVTIGRKPLEVQNLSCISQNWELLICTWIEPNNGVKTNYSISYLPPKRAHRERLQCPTHEPGKCVWTLFSNPPYRRNFEYINVYVEGTNKFGNSSQRQKIHHWAYVIPSAPVGLTALSRTPHSIYLQFDIGLFETFDKGLFYKVNYTWNTSEFWNINEYKFNDLRRVKDLVYINVTDLPHPNVAYDFRISMKSALADDSGWSEPAALVARTSPSAPYRSPKTDIGSFEILAFSPQSHSRDVLVYWQQIPDEEYNGDHFKYEFAVFEDDVEVNVKPDKLEKTYAQFNKLSFSSYRFVIKSTNDVGSAPYTSEVKLPRQKDVLSEPTLFTKVDLGDGVYKLSWKVPNATNERVTNYTVFWCENDRGYPYRCLNSLNWTHLSANTFKHIFNAKTSKGYQFAISVNSVNSSSGMMWALCTVLHNHVNKMRNIFVGKAGSHYIDLKWKLDCDERVEGIKGYNITYCPIVGNTCTEPLKTYLIYGDVTTNHGNITGLTPYTSYKMSVAIFTDKLLGPASDWISNSTLDAAPNMTGIKVEVTNITDSTAIVRWTAPSNSNGILDHYEVYYEADKKVTVNETFVVLTGLRSYDMYHIRVVACTAVCSRTDPVALHTKIGTPKEVRNISTEKLNAVDIKLKWEPPAMPAGPNPLYDVKIQFDEPDTSSNFSEFETKETEKVVKIPCNQEPYHSAYTFFIRAKNTDDSDLNDIKNYYGPWSSAYTIDCMNNGGLPTMWKIMLIFSLCTLSLSVFAFFGKKGFYKCQQMKKVEVVLPAKFTIPPLYHNEIKDAAYHVDIKSWTDPNEIDHLNKLSDADQSSIDCIDLDLDTDRETSRSSSGCYTS